MDVPTHARNQSFAFICFSLLFSCFSGCREKPAAVTVIPKTNHVIAQIGSHVITIEDLHQEVSRREKTSRKSFQNAAEVEALLNEMVQFEMLYANAQKAGYDRDPEMQQRFRRMVVAKYQEDHLPD